MTIALPLTNLETGTWGQLRDLGAAAEGVSFRLRDEDTPRVRGVSGINQATWVVRGGIPVPGPWNQDQTATWSYIASKQITLVDVTPHDPLDLFVVGERLKVRYILAHLDSLPNGTGFGANNPVGNWSAEPYLTVRDGALVDADGNERDETWLRYYVGSMLFVSHTCWEGGPFQVGQVVQPSDVRPFAEAADGLVLQNLLEGNRTPGVAMVRYGRFDNYGGRNEGYDPSMRIVGMNGWASLTIPEGRDYWYSDRRDGLRVLYVPRRLANLSPPAEVEPEVPVYTVRYIPPPSPDHPQCPVCRRQDVRPGMRHREIRGYTAPWCAGPIIAEAFKFEAVKCERCPNMVWGSGLCSTCHASVTRRQSGQALPEDYRFGVELETEGNQYRTSVFDAILGRDKENARPWQAVVDRLDGWEDKDDGSLRGKHAEVVSPPLPFTRANLETVGRVVYAMRKAGSRTNPARCGLHVHVGCEDLTDEQLRSIMEHWWAWQNVVLDALPPVAARAFYCRPLPANSRASVVYGNYNRYSIAEHSDDRYWALNFSALNKHGTVEWRFFNGTMNAGRVKAAIEFAVRFVARAASDVWGWDSTRVALEPSRENMLYVLDQLGITDRSARWYLLGKYQLPEDRPVALPEGVQPRRYGGRPDMAKPMRFVRTSNLRDPGVYYAVHLKHLEDLGWDSYIHTWNVGLHSVRETANYGQNHYRTQFCTNSYLNSRDYGETYTVIIREADYLALEARRAA